MRERDKQADRQTHGREGGKERKMQNQKMYTEEQNKDLLEKFVLFS